MLLSAIDVTVVYLTVRMAGLPMAGWTELPLAPLAVFLMVVKLSVLLPLFTAVGGQTIGKMAMRIRVVTDEDRPLDAAAAAVRSLAGTLSAISLGLGYVPALFGAGRHAVHDRLTRSRVRSVASRYLLIAPDRLMDRLGVLCATCAYLGYVRTAAPGTFGSALGLLLFWAVRSTDSAGIEAAVMAVLFAVGVWSGTEAERHFRGVDPGPIVIDEVFGMLVTLAFLPVSMTGAIVRLLRLPSPRHREALAGQPVRGVARRARHHGR